MYDKIPTITINMARRRCRLTQPILKIVQQLAVRLAPFPGGEEQDDFA
jgi:hypothetical protein